MDRYLAQFENMTRGEYSEYLHIVCGWPPEDAQSQAARIIQD